MEYLEVKNSARRSRKVKNLVEVVESIFFQDENEEVCNSGLNKSETLPKTPQTKRIKGVETPRASKTALQELFQTPRRSCRKSIKPSHEYEDIVNRSTVSYTRSARKHLPAAEVDSENCDADIVQPKWTPAKVGRVSQKRSRKSKRSAKSEKKDKENQFVDDVLETCAGDGEKALQDHDKAENIEQDLFDQQNEINAQHLSNSTEPINISDDVLEINYVSKQVEDVKIELVDQSSKIDSVPFSAQRVKFDEIIDNMENLNVKADKHIQENEECKQEQVEVEKKISDAENSNELKYLVQENVEDSQKFMEKSNQEGICIIYESNMSSKQVEEKNKADEQNVIKKSILSKNMESSFGCYLKSQNINISELGLNPLKDEEEGKYTMDDMKTSEENEEMPSLILCDDDFPCKKLNDTIKIEKIFNGSEQSEDVMETLELSDDAETPSKRLRCEQKSEIHSKLSSPKILAMNSNIPTTTKESTTAEASTPKQPKKVFRLPTPYKHQKSPSNYRTIENIKNTPNKNLSNVTVMPLTTLGPKEAVLRGIRKRSLSMCVEGNEEKLRKFLAGPLNKVKEDRTVSFYSPANQTAVIEDFDIIIAKGLKKSKTQNDGSSNFVTTRRKRSISLDESIISKSFSKLPRPVGQNLDNKQNILSLTSKPLARKKIPNFAAIHQKQFQKMENLVDHVHRKQERSKNLINSATKLKPVSYQKCGSILKNTSNSITVEKTKAIKRIDLGNSLHVNKSLFDSTVITQDLNKTTELGEAKAMKSLPDPRLDVAKSIKSETISRRPLKQQKDNKCVKPSHSTNVEKPGLKPKTEAVSKPAFNLSTSLMVKPTKSSSKLIEKFNTSHMGNDNKPTSNLQRHMDLFKSRLPASRSGKTSRNNEVILKGVRSNRRFELQMQHRKNLEH